ncbi:MAG TPA: hypothetical protein VF676_03125 [Flavobacterium sp.]|jgi:hypothetical protein
MIITPFLCILGFLILAYSIQNSQSNAVENQIKNISNLGDKILGEKLCVQCEVNTVGLRDRSFIFERADLLFLNDALILIGYYHFFKRKIYKPLIVLSQEKVFYRKSLPGARVFVIKNFNLNSFNGDVYLEFGEASFTKTNVEIRLKHLSEEEKRLIHF